MRATEYDVRADRHGRVFGGPWRVSGGAEFPTLDPDWVQLCFAADGTQSDILMTREGELASIKTLCVAPEYRGDGVGGALVATAHRLAHAASMTWVAHTLMTDVGPSMSISQLVSMRFYDGMRCLNASMTSSLHNNLCSLLCARANANRAGGAHSAGVDGVEHRVSYGELQDAVARFAGSLQQQGIAPGDRVLVFVPMSIELYVVPRHFSSRGCRRFHRSGMGLSQIRSALRLTDPSLVLVTPKIRWLQLMFPSLWLRRWRSIDSRLVATRLKDSTALPVAEVIAEHPALLTFTSGTTGRPKGVMRTHSFLLSQHRALTSALGTTATDVEMPVLPIFLLNTLAVGATAVIPPVGRRVADVDGGLVVELMERYRDDVLCQPSLFMRQ